MTNPLDDFFDGLAFTADPFQVEAGEAVARGANVVVSAPTGAGKTLVADAAIHLARQRGTRVFYTTPIKALSNQKFGDLVRAHGADRVGLLTGDNVINGGGQIVVMTTEVLRNMIYADSSAVDDVGFVILDEVHYLQDRFRGAVWEEVIIHAPRHLQMVCLSATIANADEFAGWVEERRGKTELVVTTERPVPLESMYMVADRGGDQGIRLHPMFTVRDGRRRTNSKLEHLLSLEKGRRRRFRTPRRTEVVADLAERGMLPAIFFVFSRAGCDAATLAVLESGLRLADPNSVEIIRDVAERRTELLSSRDLAALDYGRWLAGLEAGVAAHHAGMVPAFKEAVEELFAHGHLQVVFATETLSLGINMPARTVVLDSLSKFDGEGHSLLKPGDYTQLTGRAGRRGIDVIGHGVVLHSPYVRLDQVLKIAELGAHPLRSSFRPTYNMAANLIGNYEEHRAEQLLTASFAQYQREGEQVSSQRHLAEMGERLVDERLRAECERGSVEEYAELVSKSPERRMSLGELHPGDVLDVPAGQHAGRYVVVRRLNRGTKGMRVLVMGTSGRMTTLGTRDLGSGVERAGRIELPQQYRGGEDRKFQQLAVRKLRAIPPAEQRKQSRVEVDHPVARCPDAAAHLQWLGKAERTARRLERLRTELRDAGVGLVEEFHAITDLLAEFGYVDGWSLTPRGTRLRFVYNEMDLLLTEALEQGVFWSLTPPEMAAVASTFVYEPRSDQESAPEWPTPAVAARFDRIRELWEIQTDAERRHRLSPSRRPDGGFAKAAYRWASMVELDDLEYGALAAGDFVRVSRQLVDLLQQIRDAFPELAEDARAALRAVDRGVVAAQGAG
ncbi:MAG TPA: DEAD/DEAH box helicase [Acidimicrobiia bacterium]|nr:DEAD/DEAH box helicase [Acidimicrobiia bacterium]